MLDGAFERAWRVSDAILAERAGHVCGHLPHHLRWVWRGAPLAGRDVLIRSYHGLGDTIQFIRLVPIVARLARSVAVEAQAELLPLLASVPGIGRLIPLDAPPPHYDLDVELMEVPHALRLTLQTVPSRVPYLRAPSAPPETVPPPAETLRVGLVWAAGNWRAERSMALCCLSPLADLPGVTFQSLQQGPAGRALEEARPAWLAPPPATPMTILDTASLIQQLDLVITVDTMVAHLAGALGRPVWTLLDADADWRWMHARCDSPWFPTMRLSRQPRRGAWEPVVQRTRQELAALVRAQSAAIGVVCGSNANLDPG
jgi:hypothetical protein